MLPPKMATDFDHFDKKLGMINLLVINFENNGVWSEIGIFSLKIGIHSFGFNREPDKAVAPKISVILPLTAPLQKQ